MWTLQLFCYAAFFQEKESEPRGHQYSYFEAIFCGREGEPLLHETRISLLINLCSLAVQYPCYSVLNHISQWLHKVKKAVFLNLRVLSLLCRNFNLSSVHGYKKFFLLDW